MENNMSVINSERGKELILLNYNKYSFVRNRQDGLTKWKCTKKNCTASILTTINKVTLEETIGNHNHATDTPQKIERQILRENCKRATEVSTRPLKIIRSELVKNDLTNILTSNISTVRKAMYDKRRKHYPKFPTSLIEAIGQLQLMKNEEVCLFKRHQFVFVPNTSDFVCVTTEENLKFMVEQTKFFADGTFDYAPNFFLQMYTIHTYRNGFYVPLVYFFLPNKSEQMYVNMWKYLSELCQIITGRSLNVEELHLDFEIGAHHAAKRTFPTIQIYTCRFHLGQAWWRKINSEKSLRNAYMDKNDELGQWLKLFFGLPFLNSNEVEDAFLELMAECPRLEDGHVFSDYVLNTYIEPDALFPPYFWAKEPSVHPRTTNGAESFHRTYNGQFYSTHPPTHLVLSILKETQAQTAAIISSINNGIHKNMAKKDLDRIQSTITAYDTFRMDKNFMTFLKTVGNKYLGRNLN